MPDEQVKVIQADRRTAFEIARFFLGNGDSLPDELLSGECERHFLLDAVARHRLSHPVSSDVPVCPICQEAAHEYFETRVIHPCPKCGSEKGDWCRTADGTPLPAYHDVRLVSVLKSSTPSVSEEKP